MCERRSVGCVEQWTVWSMEQWAVGSVEQWTTSLEAVLVGYVGHWFIGCVEP